MTSGGKQNPAKTEWTMGTGRRRRGRIATVCLLNADHSSCNSPQRGKDVHNRLAATDPVERDGSEGGKPSRMPLVGYHPDYVRILKVAGSGAAPGGRRQE